MRICLAGLLFYVIYLVRDAVVWFFFGLVISVLLNPIVVFFQMFKIPKVVAIVLTYFLIFGTLGLIIYLSAPIFIDEIRQFSVSVPQYLEKLSPIFEGLKIEALQNIDNLTEGLAQGLEKFSSGILNAIVAFFGGIASTVFILSIAFFISLEESGVEKFLTLITPKKYEGYVMALFERCQKKISGWFGVRIIACFFVAAASAVVFYLFRIDYVLILASLGGVMNFIPFLGSFFAGLIILLFVGMTASWGKAIMVLIAFIIIQQIENNIISPVLMKKFIGLPPVMVLISLVVGGQIFGFLGALFAVPVFGIIYEFTKEFLEKKKEEESLQFV